ncbi:MAG: transposase [Bacteroidales bacterium]|jgi:REP element-mobilizing transposase RayT|nr:transposase [Bacteroidales bacterium]
MSFISIWVHSVWTTKNSIPFLKEGIFEHVRQHILDNAAVKGIFIDRLNGDLKHLHALISLGGSQDISNVMRLIKGESSFWINKNRMTALRFEWQDDFWSVSIGKNDLHRIRKYIDGQKEHHRKVTLEEELIDLFGNEPSK